MRGTIQERAVEVAHYIVEKNCTVRDAAKAFHISKSTVHKDVSQRLIDVSPMLAVEVRQVLEFNKAQRHIRGGMATCEKYRHIQCRKSQTKAGQMKA